MSSAADERYRLGVLMVHGIGRQRRGDTLVRWTEALIGWCPAVGPRRLSATARDATLGDNGAPPHVELGVSVDGETSEWLVAEAWWAESLTTPTFTGLVNWSFRVVPWTFASHASTALHRNARRIGEAGWSTRPLWAARLILVAGTGLVLALLAFPIVLMALSALTLLGVLPIPRIRSFVRGAQRLLTGTVGDAMVLLESPVQAAAVLGGVRRDLAWLRTRCRSVVVVGHSQGAAIALEALRSEAARSEAAPSEAQRSGDPAVEQAEDGCVLFTFGSGVQKLDALRALRDAPSRWVPWATTAVVLAVAVAGAVLVRRLLDGSISGGEIAEGLGTILLVVTVVSAVMVIMNLRTWRELKADRARWREELDRNLLTLDEPGTFTPFEPSTVHAEERWWEDIDWTYYAGLLIFATFMESFRRLTNPSPLAWSTFFGLVAIVLAVGFVARRLPPGETGDAPASVTSWVDVYASADPVPNGPLRQAPRRPWQQDRNPASSYRVWNLRSFLTDHSRYWTNTDTFVPRLVRVLCREADTPLDGWTDDALEQADRRRGRRVAVLKYVRLATIGLAVTSVALWWDRLDDTGRWALDRVDDGLGSVPFGLERLLPDQPDSATLHGVGVGLVVAGAVLAYHGLYLAWRWWNGVMARRSLADLARYS